jgi:hypothetical protein
MASDDIRQAFANARWDDLYPRLCLVAAQLVRRMAWLSQRRGVIPGALEPNDLVNQATMQTLAGSHVWNPALKSMFLHLSDVMKRNSSNLINSKEARTVTVVDSYTMYSQYSDAISNGDSEYITYVNDFIKYVTENDEWAGKICVLMIQVGLTNPIEISNAVDRSVSFVNNKKKAIKKLAQRYVEASVSENSERR